MLSTPNVFVVVEDEALRDAVTISLEMAGYRVAPFASARQFLDDAPAATDHACLLVDLELAEMDGIALVDTLRRRGTRLPAVVMHGRLRPPARLRSLPDGIVGLLDKPFGDRELLGRIDHALADRPMRVIPYGQTPR